MKLYLSRSGLSVQIWFMVSSTTISILLVGETLSVQIWFICPDLFHGVFFPILTERDKKIILILTEFKKERGGAAVINFWPDRAKSANCTKPLKPLTSNNSQTLSLLCSALEKSDLKVYYWL